MRKLLISTACVALFAAIAVVIVQHSSPKASAEGTQLTVNVKTTVKY